MEQLHRVRVSKGILDASKKVSNVETRISILVCFAYLQIFIFRPL